MLKVGVGPLITLSRTLSVEAVVGAAKLLVVGVLLPV